MATLPGAELVRPDPVQRFFDFSLLGLLASGYLAVAGSGYLDLPTIVLTAAGFTLRALIIVGLIRLRVSDRVVTAATLAYTGFYPLDYVYFSKELVPATVHLVFFLATVKLLTARTDRDYFYLKVIAFLELLAASIVSSNLNFFLFLALFLVFGVATFSSYEIRRSARGPRKSVRLRARAVNIRLAVLTLFLSAGILALSAALFFVLPRTARAAFQRLVPERYHVTGFSSEIALGQTGELRRQSTPVMRVRVHNVGQPLPLKWRGAALATFDGKRWYNRSTPRQPLLIERNQIWLVNDAERRSRVGGRIAYEVHLASIGSDVLFFAGVPEWVHINLPMIFRGPGDGYRAAYGSSDGLSYYAHSFVGEGGEPGTAEPLAPNLVKLYLELPRLDERVPSLAHQVIANQTGEEAQARALERYFRQQFGYTMELLAHEVPDPLAYFLFERRKGHCEYFASAMAVMLRSLGIPSRVVTGFQSGTYNPITGWYVVRASDAHSWVEAFIRGRGWLTFDPTPPDPSLATTTLWARVRLLLDAADTFWHEWVLNYDIERQLSLAEHMERSGRTFRMQWVDRLASSIAALKTKTEGAARRYGWVVLTGVLLAWLASRMAPRLWAWWTTRERLRRLHRGQVKAADATLLYTRALRALKRKGYEKPAWITPAEFARVLPMSPISLLVDDLTAAYNELRFGSKAEVAPRFIRLLEQLEKEVISGG